MNADLKKAFMWGLGIGLGFMALSYVTGTIKRL